MSGNEQKAGQYFPAIEGLRAVAVLAVVLFHIGRLVPEGYVGVDIFFVISGFVVAHSAASLPAGSLREFAAAFYARRFIRIAPALLACLLVTTVVSALVIPNAWLSKFNAVTGLAAFFGVSNAVLAWSADGYWAPRAEFNPFTQTWSLGVEEQFYLLFPLLYFAWRTGRKRASAIILLVLGLGSLVAVALTQSTSVSFYSIHTRFWELAVGVTLYFTMASWSAKVGGLSRGLVNAFAVIVAIGLGCSVLVVDENAFPWPGALLPVVSTAGAIVLAVAAPGAWLSRILGSKPMVAAGKGSYSLYLWHWPVVVFARWTTGLDTASEMAVVAALAVLLATGSYFVIERPLRSAAAVKRAPRSTVVLVGILAMVTASVAAGATVYAQRWISLSVTSDEALWSPGAHLKAADGTCAVGYSKDKVAAGEVVIMRPEACALEGHTVFTFGDSHAWAYSAMLGLFTQRTGWTSEMMTEAGCQFMNLLTPMAHKPGRCREFAMAAIERVRSRARPGDVLFLPSLRVRRLGHQSGPGDDDEPARRDEAIAETVAVLKPIAEAGVRIVFEMPKPVFRAPLFRCSDWFNRMNPICAGGFTESRIGQERHREAAVTALRSAAAGIPGATLWDPLPRLCSDTSCSALRDGKPLYFDGDHLSAFGNAALYEDFSRVVLGAKGGAQ